MIQVQRTATARLLRLFTGTHACHQNAPSPSPRPFDPPSHLFQRLSVSAFQHVSLHVLTLPDTPPHSLRGRRRLNQCWPTRAAASRSISTLPRHPVIKAPVALHRRKPVFHVQFQALQHGSQVCRDCPGLVVAQVAALSSPLGADTALSLMPSTPPSSASTGESQRARSTSPRAFLPTLRFCASVAFASSRPDVAPTAANSPLARRARRRSPRPAKFTFLGRLRQVCPHRVQVHIRHARRHRPRIRQR